MKIIIPVSERDLSLATALSELLVQQGGLGAHHGVLLTAPNVTARDGEIASNLQKAFGTFTRVPLEGGITEVGGPQHPFQPHVFAANQMFQSAVRWLANIDNRDEWYWFEADNVPLSERWADELARDYFNSMALKRPFLGKVLPLAIYENKEGSVTIREDEAQPYMMGSGIYPPRFEQYSQLWKSAKSIPWDVTCQWEIVPKATATDKIMHNHSTKAYKVIEDNKLSCQLVSEPSRSKTEITIPEGTLVFHGCKDTSLIDIVKEKPHSLSSIVGMIKGSFGQKSKSVVDKKK
jgi:hypothetical protein